MIRMLFLGEMVEKTILNLEYTNACEWLKYHCTMHVNTHAFVACDARVLYL